MTKCEFFELLSAMAAVGTMVVAWNALGAWREQLKGTSKYAVAKKLLHCTYVLRESIADCRWGYISPEELPLKLNESPPERAFRIHEVYRTRFSPVRQAGIAFDEAAIEAEVLLGKSVSDSTAEVRKIIGDLRLAINEYCHNIDRGGRLLTDPAWRKQITDTVQNMQSESPFTKRVEAMVINIETITLPHLK